MLQDWLYGILVVLSSMSFSSFNAQAIELAQVPNREATPELPPPQDIIPPLPLPDPVTPKTSQPPEDPLQFPSLPNTTPELPETVPESITVTEFEFTGNTVFSSEELAEKFTSSLTNTDEPIPLSLSRLLQIAADVANLYNEQGYITTGAIVSIPEATRQQKKGKVQIRVLEGVLPKIAVEGTQRINPDYVRYRVELGVTRPFNLYKLEPQISLLQKELLFKDLEFTLSAGEEIGESVLVVRVTEVDYGRIAALIEQLKGKQSEKELETLETDELERRQRRRLDAINSLMRLGTPAAIDAALGRISDEAKAAVPSLIDGLKDPDSDVRSSAALLLGKMGIEAKTAIPSLVDSLKNSDAKVRQYAVSALKSIAASLYEKADTLPLVKLSQYISNLKAAVSMIQAPQDKLLTEEIADLNFALEALKNKRNQRLFNNEILKNPWLWGAISYLTLLLGIFWLRPLWLLRFYELLKPIRFKVPLFVTDISLGLLLFPKYHRRVLDAWVTAHIKSVREEFWQKDSVRARQVYIPIPVVLDGNTVAQLNSSHLRSIFDKRRSCLLIWGEGGIGKTSLSFQIAKWAASDDRTERICKHKMLPVLIETELDGNLETGKSPLVTAIRGQIQDLTNAINPISEELLEHLLREQRILVIVDHFSEMSEATRKVIRPELPDFPVNALVITSRVEEKLSQVTKNTLKPLRIEGNRLSSFVDAYLTHQGKRDYFTDAEFFAACSRLSTMIGTHQITVLLAKLYVEQLIAAKEGTDIYQLPENIPDLMLAYLNELNRSVTTEKINDHKVHQDAKVIAWECLRQTYQPTAISREVAIMILGGDDAEVRLKYLEEQLGLVQKNIPAKDKIRFTLDPLAEYLAGLHLVDSYKDDADLWQEFLVQTAAISGGPESIHGFLLAVWECCSVKGKEILVPDCIIEELHKAIR